ncbi:MAG: HAMP domain-containing sensor histidine kinase [Coleofasciculaceae cyanobacterium]
MVQKWLLPSLSEVLAQSEQTELVNQDTLQREKDQRDATSHREQERAKVEREWSSAIATLEELLVQAISQTGGFSSRSVKKTRSASSKGNSDSSSQQGLVLAGPLPVLGNPQLLASFQTGIFTSEAFNALSLMPFQLAPSKHELPQQVAKTVYELPLFPLDPLTKEKFCLVFTRSFSLVMVAGNDADGVPAFRFSFDPEVIQQAWSVMRPRLLLTSPYHLGQLEELIEKFSPKVPDYRIVMQFGRQLLRNLPEPNQEESVHTITVNSSKPIMAQSGQTPSEVDNLADRQWRRLEKNREQDVSEISNSLSDTPDVELLKALTHEIRTPLTTIRTLTKLLLKRRDLAPEVTRRLEIIEHECLEQINRMELIFRAVELETTASKQGSVNLTSMSLTQIFQQNIPRWQKQAQRRNISLDVSLPQNLPTVVSNPHLLDQMLTGLMENFTRSLPSGGQIQVQVIPAGNQLKLQFQSQLSQEETDHSAHFTDSTCQTLKSIGQLLMFQPETGSLSLNLDVTKNLFQALGGKLIVRQRPQAGEVMTVFLPLEVSNGQGCQQSGVFTRKSNKAV